MNPTSSHKTLRLLTWFTLAVTVILTTGLGGAVTSAEVGMAYPTWPNINGWSLFNFFYQDIAEQFGIGASLEHTHRQAGTLLGLLSIALVAFSWRRPHTRRLALWNLSLVIIQGGLGAFRVLDNAQIIGILHALGAQAVVVCLVAVLKSCQPTPSLVRLNAASRIRLWSLIGIALLFVNLLAAASLRHKSGAFAGHLLLALLASGVLLFSIRLILLQEKSPKVLRADAKRLLATLGLQLGLGIGTWAFILGPLALEFNSEQTRFVVQNFLATAHLVVGMTVMAMASAVFLESKRSTQWTG